MPKISNASYRVRFVGITSSLLVAVGRDQHILSPDYIPNTSFFSPRKALFPLNVSESPMHPSRLAWCVSTWSPLAVTSKCTQVHSWFLSRAGLLVAGLWGPRGIPGTQPAGLPWGPARLWPPFGWLYIFTLLLLLSELFGVVTFACCAHIPKWVTAVVHTAGLSLGMMALLFFLNSDADYFLMIVPHCPLCFLL